MKYFGVERRVLRARLLPLSHVKSANANGSGFACVRAGPPSTPCRPRGPHDESVALWRRAGTQQAKPRAPSADTTYSIRTRVSSSEWVFHLPWPRARRRAIVTSGGAGCAPAGTPSRARLRSSTLTRGSPKKPNWRPVVRASSARTAAGSACRARATRATCRYGVRRRDVRIESGRGRRHHVRRDLPLHRAVVLHRAVDRLRDQRVGELPVRRPLVRAATNAAS